MLGQPAVGRDLAAIDRQQWRFARLALDIEHVVTGDRRRVVGLMVVVKRPDTGIRADGIRRRNAAGEVGIHRVAEVLDLVIGDGHRARVAVIRNIRGADQRVVVFIGYGENDALVGVLKDVCVRPFVQLGNDDVTAFDQAEVLGLVVAEPLTQEEVDPRTRRVDNGAGLHRAFGPCRRVPERGVPKAVATFGPGAFSPYPDFRPSGLRVHGIQNDETRILDPAIGIGEPFHQVGVQAFPFQGLAQLERLGAGQGGAGRQMVVHEQAHAHHPGGAQQLVVRQDEAHRPDDVRCRLKQDFAFGQRFPHQAESVHLQVAQAAVDQL